MSLGNIVIGLEVRCFCPVFLEQEAFVTFPTQQCRFTRDQGRVANTPPVGEYIYNITVKCTHYLLENTHWVLKSSYE